MRFSRVLLALVALVVAAVAQEVCTSTRLNIRSGAGTSHRILFTSSQGQRLKQLRTSGSWVQVQAVDGSHFGTIGWAHKDYLGSCGGGSPPGGITMPGTGSNTDSSLEPSRKVSMSGLTGLKRTMATVHNAYGRLLQDEASKLGVTASALAATIHVESGGRGFADSRLMIIRFENHVFKRSLKNDALYNQHFKHSSSQSWKGHYWRRSTSSPWVAQHTGRQSDEWEVLQFAQGLNNDAALLSASYGAPQVMGFNYQAVGYRNVRDMFTEFSKSIRAQFKGMFAFIKGKSACIGGLRSRDWARFAGCYNGSGQREIYGRRIGDAVTAFESVVR